jgi:hypothetical protein
MNLIYKLENEYKDVNYNSSDYSDFQEVRSNMIKELGEWITPYMNHIHNLSYSELFWTRVLRHYLKTTVNRKHLIDDGLESNFRRYFVNVDAYEKPLIRTRFILSLSYWSKFFLIKSNKKKILKKLEAHSRFTIGHLDKELSSDDKGVSIPEYFPLILLPDVGAKKRLNSLVKKESNHFLKYVLKAIPCIYVEYFKTHMVKVEDIDFNGKEFHAEHTFSLATEILLGHAFDYCAKVYHYQGGCGHGEEKYLPELINYSIATGYVTYGWKINTKDIPGKAYRLESFKHEYQKHLLLNKGNKFFDIVIILGKLQPNKISNYRISLEIFRKNIDRTVFKNVIIRPRPLSKYFKLGEKGIRKKLGLDDDYYLVDNMSDSIAKLTAKGRINIMLYTPATNLYECALVDHPFLALDLYPEPSEVFKKHLDFFHSVGIMHKEIGSLIIFLNTTDIISWWKKLRNSFEYKLFLKEFCGQHK